MPVAFQINHNRRLNTIEAIVSNLSDVALSIQVNIVNPGTHNSSNTQVDLAPHGQKFFGLKEGVELSPGDQVTLQSPSNQDLTLQFP